MYEKFTDRCRFLLRTANSLAQKQKNEFVGTTHLLLAFFDVDCLGRNILKKHGVTKEAILNILPVIDEKGEVNSTRLEMTPLAKKIIEKANENAQEYTYTGTEHFLLALLQTDGTPKTIIDKISDVSSIIRLCNIMLGKIQGEANDLINIVSDFQPYGHYDADADQLEYYVSGESHYAKYIDKNLTLYYNQLTNEVIGVCLYGVKKLINDN
jgi:ATP-dependent Clp protease ATP-binding subunit ClpA